MAGSVDFQSNTAENWMASGAGRREFEAAAEVKPFCSNGEIELNTIIPGNGENGKGSSGSGGLHPAGMAVLVRNATKSYKSGQPVLNGLSLTVPCGSIYGLLGSSGCGKTTLLSCLVGIQKLDQGRILIFGEEPGSKSIGIPGRNLGYMPQDISLYAEFSVEETLNYFGSLGGLSKGEIWGRRKSLTALLNLPDGKGRVGALSGGQQRRVSLVVALLGAPELLILDEPTVGVDPLIRQSIWAHLQDLARSQRTTVIITTHYMEECRRADNVGVLRNGRLLMERAPAELMLEHGTNNLEGIILKLCRADEEPLGEEDATGYSKDMAKVSRQPLSEHRGRLNRIRALTGKNLVVLFRNPLLLFLVTLIVPVLLVLIFVALSHDPYQLSLGVVNYEELSGVDSNCSDFYWTGGECSLEMLSCRYFSSVRRDVLDLVPYEREEEAEAAVRSGAIWGYILIPSNYSTALYERSSFGGGVPDEWTLNSSRILVRLDESSKQVSVTIKVALLTGYSQFISGMLEDCGYDPRLGEYDLKYQPPIFGKEGTDFCEFVAPAAALAFLFFFPIVTTSVRFIKERKSEVLLRSIVGGVQTWEMMVAYLISEFCVLLVQSLLTYAVITKMFHMTVLGSDGLVVAIFLLSGYGGVSMGFFLGTICSEEIQAAIMAIAAFFPNLLLCGLVWPVEGMVQALQYIVQVFPCTLAADSVRSVISRGWDLSHPGVWPGVAILIGYIAGYFVLTVLFHRVLNR